MPYDDSALRFGAFELRPAERRLLRDGQAVVLGARAIDLLIALARERGRLLTKARLLDIVWPDVVVEEANLHVQMSALRKVLGPDAIVTVPGRGYQFVAPSAAAGGPAAAAAAGPDADVLPLIGRDAEVAAVNAALEHHARVTITGIGGAGKTALARAAVAVQRTRQRHGVVWVDLLQVAEAPRLTALLAAALELSPRDDNPQALAAASAALDLLLVLDNGEHLGAALAAVADALLGAAPRMRLLVTSQAPLQLYGEQVLRLGGLSVPALPCTPEEALRHGAVALFVARARDADRSFRLDAARLPDVVSLCRALDGSALGLQVAAALLARMPGLAAGRPRRRRGLVGRPPGTAGGIGWPAAHRGVAAGPGRRGVRRCAGPATAAGAASRRAGCDAGPGGIGCRPLRTPPRRRRCSSRPHWGRRRCGSSSATAAATTWPRPWASCGGRRRRTVWPTACRCCCMRAIRARPPAWPTAWLRPG